MKKAATFMIDESVLAQMRQWIANQPAPPSQSAVVEAALRQFLESRKGRKR
jgi:Arc/MetJ-type ribon-helix-helix transcriptional regulator